TEACRRPTQPAGRTTIPGRTLHRSEPRERLPRLPQALLPGLQDRIRRESARVKEMPSSTPQSPQSRSSLRTQAGTESRAACAVRLVSPVAANRPRAQFLRPGDERPPQSAPAKLPSLMRLYESAGTRCPRHLFCFCKIPSALHSRPMPLYMVVEHFKDKNAVPVYRRFRDRGRLAPEGLRYLSSWVDENLERCYQLMETDDRSLLDRWISHWNDLVDFEVYPVLSSQQAAEKIAPRL